MNKAFIYAIGPTAPESSTFEAVTGTVTLVATTVRFDNPPPLASDGPAQLDISLAVGDERRGQLHQGGVPVMPDAETAPALGA